MYTVPSQSLELCPCEWRGAIEGIMRRSVMWLKFQNPFRFMSFAFLAFLGLPQYTVHSRVLLQYICTCIRCTYVHTHMHMFSVYTCRGCLQSCHNDNHTALKWHAQNWTGSQCEIPHFPGPASAVLWSDSIRNLSSSKFLYAFPAQHDVRNRTLGIFPSMWYFLWNFQHRKKQRGPVGLA